MTARATYDFTGATALVTGGTSGIGHAIATKLRDAGATVTTTGRKPQAADYSVDLEGIAYHQLELTDRAGIQELAADFSTLDILVNNAGAIFAGGLDESTPDGFRATVDLNLFGPFELTSALHGALARSTAKGGACVVGLSSLSTVRAVPMVPAYGAAKSGVLSMTRNFANTSWTWQVSGWQWLRSTVDVSGPCPTFRRLRQASLFFYRIERALRRHIGSVNRLQIIVAAAEFRQA